MQQSKIPENTLNQLAEHTSCFIIFYFDGDGNPAFYRNLPEIKDAMAITQFVGQYAMLNGDLTSSEGSEESKD